jgi:hypothetical protein
MQNASRYSDQPGALEPVLLTQIGNGVPRSSPRTFNFNIPGYQTRFEVITPNSEGSHRQWKDFQHYKIVPGDPITGIMGGLPILTNASNPSWIELGYGKNPYIGAGTYNGAGGYDLPFGDPGALNAGLQAMYVVQPDQGFVPPPADLEMHKQRALNVMLPAIKAELSLVNTIIELKDFKRPVKRVLEFIRTPKGWKNFVISQWGNRALGELDRRAAQGYLEYRFNLAPLVSDICGIYAALSRAHSQMNDLLTRQGRVQRRHYAFNWREFDEYETSNGAYVGYFAPAHKLDPCNLLHHTREVFSDPTVFHAMIEYNYNYTRWQVQTAALGSLLDSLGVNLNPAIVWNAIPFTFIVDWVIGVSRYLQQYTYHNMEPEINIHRALWSVKRGRRIRVQKWTTSGYYGYLCSNRVSLPEVSETSYRRTNWIPTRSSIQLSGLSPTEFSLGAALVIGSGRRRYRRSR